MKGLPVAVDGKWARRFVALAEHVALWSKDPSTKVGAVVVDDLRIVRGLGYNGFPRGIEDTDERLKDRPTKYGLVVHAEANAILNAIGPIRGCTLYSTEIPCPECCKLIIQSGIAHVYSPVRKTRWEESWPILREAGVEVFRVFDD